MPEPDASGWQLAGCTLTQEHLSVLGADLTPAFTACVCDHQRGVVIGVWRLFDLLRTLLLRSMNRTVADRVLSRDRLWLQARMLELVFDVAWYLAGPQLRLVPPSAAAGVKVA